MECYKNHIIDRIQPHSTVAVIGAGAPLTKVVFYTLAKLEFLHESAK